MARHVQRMSNKIVGRDGHTSSVFGHRSVWDPTTVPPDTFQQLLTRVSDSPYSLLFVRHDHVELVWGNQAEPVFRQRDRKDIVLSGTPEQLLALLDGVELTPPRLAYPSRSDTGRTPAYQIRVL